MPRPRAAYVLLGALLVASAAAFVRAEQLKLRRASVGGPHVAQAFSPGCDAPHCRPRARLDFRLRRAATLTVAVVDSAGAPVRTLLPSELTMTAAAHFMRHRYFDFNAPRRIFPPERKP